MRQAKGNMRRTDAVREPLVLDVVRIPELLGEVGRTLVDIDELYKFGVQVGIAE